jgi:hypothetical protein
LALQDIVALEPIVGAPAQRSCALQKVIWGSPIEISDLFAANYFLTVYITDFTQLITSPVIYSC